MSTRELKRGGVLARVKASTLSLQSAAALMELSYRQAKRVYRRYREEGAKGLKHRNAGRVSNRATAKIRTRVLALVRAKYSGAIDVRFGPTLAAEHLASEDGITVDHETLRRWLLAAGLWSRARLMRFSACSGALVLGFRCAGSRGSGCRARLAFAGDLHTF